MTTIREYECNQCGKREAVDEQVGWLALRHLVSSPAGMQAIQRMVESDQDPAVALDGGDFCTMQCLVDFVSARLNMRQLDADIDAGITEWKDEPLPFGDAERAVLDEMTGVIDDTDDTIYGEGEQA